MAKTEKNDKDFALRLPKSLFNKLKAQSEKNERSINWEIVNILKKSLSVFIFSILCVSCKHEPEFIIKGVGYYTKKVCLQDSSWTEYGYRYGISYRGKYEWSYGSIHKNKCLQSSIDTLLCETH